MQLRPKTPQNWFVYEIVYKLTLFQNNEVKTL